MKISIFSLAVLAAVLLAGCVYEGKPEFLAKSSSSQGEGVEIEDRVSELSRQFGVEVPATGDQAVLDPIDGGAAFGVATREETGAGRVMVTVLANLPQPEDGQTYVVRLAEADDVVLLGELIEEKAGWMLERSVNIDPNTHNMVEIVSNDQVILRGQF